MYNVLLRVLAGEMRVLFGGTLFFIETFFLEFECKWLRLCFLGADKSISKTELELPMQLGALESLCDR